MTYSVGLWTIWRLPVYFKYVSAHLENLTDMTISLTNMGDN